MNNLVRLGCLLLVPNLMLACSGDDDSGGSGGAGGTAAGGVGGMGGTGGSGGTGDGGAQCAAVCGNPAAWMCPSDPQPAMCQSNCSAGRALVLAFLPTCGDEFDNLNACVATLPADAFMCDAEGSSTIKPGYCPAENEAWGACAGG